MLNSVLDRDLGSNDDQARNDRNDAFSALAISLQDHVKDRLDLQALFKLVTDTGASDGGNLTLNGSLSTEGIIAALRLFVSKHDADLPVVCNGLGYNNLVYISLVLASLDFEASVESQGQNAVLFPMLFVEEPEAHLHPAIQYKLLKYLQNRLRETGSSRQVFVSSHSTHITSACRLDNLICLTAGAPGSPPAVAYPGRVFAASTEGQKSKKHVERFLDATKSNMLFAKGILLVEGLAEQLVVPALAAALGAPLEDRHVSVVPVDGSTFKHFLPLFGCCDEQALEKFGLGRRVACLVDQDPARKKKLPKEKRKSCWPYEIGYKSDEYDPFPVSGVVTNLQNQVASVPNVKIFSGSKTFEYDLAEANHTNTILITETCAMGQELRDCCANPNGTHTELATFLEKESPGATAALESIGDLTERAKARYASYYLLSVEDAKGAHAFDLSLAIREAIGPTVVRYPAHLVAAIRWVTETTTPGV